MKNMILFTCVFSLFGCTKEELLPSSSLEGGTWKTACQSISSGGYQINTASFSGGQFVQGSSIYATSSCASAAAKMEIKGTYVIGDKISPTSNSVMIDETLSSFKMTLYDSSAVSSYNSATYCGYSDWAVGVAKDIAGRNCGGSTAPTVGEVNYDIYIVWPYSIPSMGIVQGALNFGYNDTTYDGSTPAKRPTSTNGNFNYFRN